MSKRKQLVLDTSVLLYDKESIHSFPGNDVILPLIVLDELDRFKEKPGLLGESARYVNRYLDELRAKGSLNCSIIAAQSGPKTLQEIGDYYGISRMRVCQIEKSILKKLKSGAKKINAFDPSPGE